MPKHPRLTGAEVVGLLVGKGFTITRIRGSHHRLRHVDGRVTTVPLHRGEIIGPGLLKQIMRDARLDLRDL
jgi:predicted RNA binding protein YcfA (HicA-like mRNA interferase family)